MKKVILILIAAFGLTTIKAQVRYTSSPDTNTNATTSYVTFASINSKVKGIQASVTKVSGTVGGTVILQGTIDGTLWVTVSDTLTLTNTATQSKVWVLSATSYNSYRAAFTTTGTQVSFLKLSYLRRQDE